MNTKVEERPAPERAEGEPKSLIQVERGYSKREGEVAAPGVQPANLMQALAIAAADPRMEIAKVERLWAMHKEMMDREAERAFADALAKAQSSIQPVAKDRKNDHTKSWYATLAAIVDEVTPVMAAEGLAISFDTYDPIRDKDLPPLEKGWVRVIAIVSHRGGHSRRYHLDGPLDDAGKDGTKNKTGIQAMGSTVSYLRRYLVCMIGNVATADDNDGNGGGSGGSRMDEKEISKHLDLINGSETEADMLKRFAAAYNTAEELKDKDAQRQFLGARDNRRKELKRGARS